jgi:hypothetical protein
MDLEPLIGPWPLLSSLVLYNVLGHPGRGISPSQGRYLHTEQHNHRMNAHTSRPWVGFESTAPVFERTKTVQAFDHAATVMGDILLRILVTRLVINGFRIRWSDLLDNHQTDIQIIITLQKVTGTITQRLQHFLVRIRWAGLYPISSLLFLLLVSSLDLSWLHADRICNGTLLRYCGLSSNRAFRCYVNSLYPAVVTETFLYVLPRNRLLCHNLGDVFQQAVT